MGTVGSPVHGLHASSQVQLLQLIAILTFLLFFLLLFLLGLLFLLHHLQRIRIEAELLLVQLPDVLQFLLIEELAGHIRMIAVLHQEVDLKFHPLRPQSATTVPVVCIAQMAEIRIAEYLL